MFMYNLPYRYNLCESRPHFPSYVWQAAVKFRRPGSGQLWAIELGPAPFRNMLT